ncbi:Topoisomerase 1-associated factor 1 [Ceratocystis lukuohia]|uniref:Topoisomerase 1-associated factor 1 n=1 Tax=Ceratocystis lukuohia TaxID=2019550 RepID=A0ABR4MHT0_9PEZI
MEEDQENGIVPAVVDAHIKSLLSALGGFSPDAPSRYVPGDSAVDCLRDIKRWLRLFDEKMNLLDVARCISTTTLVPVDLLHIIRNWLKAPKNSALKEKLALASFELLVLLTWPLDRDAETTTINHYTHIPALQIAHVNYKDKLLDPSMSVLQGAVKIQLAAMAKDMRDRSTKDEGMIKMVLYLLRNIAQILPPVDLPQMHTKASEQRNAVIDQFASQKVFPFLLTVASNIGDDFRSEDMLLLEILFHLVKRVDPTPLFMPRSQRAAEMGNNMEALIAQEKSKMQRNLPSRHSRFGTMVWMERSDGKMTTLAGQDALISAEVRQQKLDASKKYRPPRGGRKKHMQTKDMGPVPSLDSNASDSLQQFVSDFLDAGFNPLFTHVRKSLERETPQVLHYHSRQFFYVVSWFLQAELQRSWHKEQKQKAVAEDADVSSFNLTASVLSQEMFILLHRGMRMTYESKTWEDLVAVMRCFNQILLLVKEIYDSKSDADIEIADNILSRLFYEEDTQELLATILRTYNGQGLEYLDVTIELVHNFTHLLSAYSSQNQDMQVRAKKAIRRNNKKKPKKQTRNVVIEDDDGNPVPSQDMEGTDGIMQEADAEGLSGSEEDGDEATAHKVTQDRKFDFQKFLHRFSSQAIVDAYVTYTSFYQELNNDQLKRAHRYFFRLGFKQDLLVMMYRVDILNLFYEMIKGQRPLSTALPVFTDWKELSKRVFRKCTQKLEERPELFVELLFSKTSTMAFFIEHGYAKKTVSTAKPRPAAELEFRYTDNLEDQIRFLVRILYSQGKHAEVKWLSETLDEAISVRKAWAASFEAEGRERLADEKEPEHIIKTGDVETKTAVLKNGHIRLFLKTLGIVRQSLTTEETLDSAWCVPSETATDHLEKCAGFLAITRMEDASPEEAEQALKEIRRRPPIRSARSVLNDDDLDEEDDFESLFPAGGPTTRKAIDAPKKKPRKRRLRQKAASDDEDDDATLSEDEKRRAERARSRLQKEREKLSKIKSEMFVHSSDDDSDTANNDASFWLREEQQRRTNQEAFLKTQAGHVNGMTLAEKAELALAGAGKKRKKDVDSDGSGSDTDMGDSMLPTFDDLQNSDGDIQMADGGANAENVASNETTNVDAAVRSNDKDIDDNDDDDDDDDVVAAPMRRNKTIGGFVLDSDDE